MKVLIACEFSGIVRDAFLAKGHDAMSCDLLPTESPGPHYQGDVFDIIDDGWDMMIAHPPCCHLACSGAAWFDKKRKDGRQQKAVDFFLKFTQTDIPKWCIENPVGIMSTIYRKPNQIVQPYEYGHPVKKTTCLWSQFLPDLVPTDIVIPDLVTLKNGKTFSEWDYKISMNHKERKHLRSKFWPGIAKAMADQWGDL